MKILRALLVAAAVVMICGISGQAMLWLTSSGGTAQYSNAFGLKFEGANVLHFGCDNASRADAAITKD